MKPIGSLRPCRLRRVSHLIDQQSKSWDEAQIRRFFHPCDVDGILKIKLCVYRLDLVEFRKKWALHGEKCIPISYEG
jgi:hypothetical protein